MENLRNCEYKCGNVYTSPSVTKSKEVAMGSGYTWMPRVFIQFVGNPTGEYFRFKFLKVSNIKITVFDL